MEAKLILAKIAGSRYKYILSFLFLSIGPQISSFLDFLFS